MSELGQLLSVTGTAGPGMEIEFNILSGKRTVLDYLAQPVARVQKRAFRD